MFPLLAGGHGIAYRHPSGLFQTLIASLRRSLLGVTVFLVALQALLCLGASCALADSGAAGTTAGSAGASSGSGVIMAGTITPNAVRVPGANPHWTLREPVAAVQPANTSDRKVQRIVGPHAQVSMFSWREILFYAMVVVVVIGGYLVFTGGHDRPSRHP
ncbi:hypothetical protein [Microbaculum marinisediminis]|uniref:Uncharacterized protein n=1 Tax=Microbaculum marinisediminis TaxID=2931392 RepID=A0AAW5R915_9HYPH|nr:hypothetical protein [Microbaculum sp. A6E488]MCT8974870.1 hypothetical protein [Microbaculum sp. A6E488]